MSHRITNWLLEFLEKTEGKLSAEELSMLKSVPENYDEYPTVLFSFFSTLYSSRLLEEALQKHADALNRASEASDNYSKRLVFATWALVGVTFLLVCVTSLLVIVGVMPLLGSSNFN